MTQREKMLAIAVGAIFVLWGLWTGAGWYFDSAERLENQLRQAEMDALDAESDLSLAQRSLRSLEAYQNQSLPSDADVARSAYSAWLVEEVEGAGLDLEDVRFTASRSAPGVYEGLAFNVEATGTLKSAVEFLYEYHRLDCLHQLSKLQMTPLDESGDSVRLSLTSVALVVDGATRSEGLPTEDTDDRLRFPSAGKYAASIGERNLFARYVPPPPPRPPAPPVEKRAVKKAPEPPPFDHAEHAYFTGVVGGSEDLQAWINVRTTGQVLRLRAGDELQVGLLNGRVQAVTPRTIIVVAGDESWVTALGEPLRSGS